MAEAELKGSIQYMSLGTLLSINCNEQRTARLVVENEDDHAEIFIENGNIVHAELDTEIGEEAFYKIFAFKEGIFSSYPDESAPQHSIEKNWSKLLLEGARLLDESSVNQSDEIDWSDFELSEMPVEHVEKIIDERMQLMVKALRSLKGILEVLVIAHDAKVLEYTAEHEPLDIVQRAKSIFETGRNLGMLIGADYFKHAIIRNSQNTILINRGQDAILVLADDNVIPDVLIDEIYMIMKRYR